MHQINVNYQSGPGSQLTSISPMTSQQLAPQKIGVHGYLSKRQMQHLTQMQAQQLAQKGSSQTAPAQPGVAAQNRKGQGAGP